MIDKFFLQFLLMVMENLMNLDLNDLEKQKKLIFENKKKIFFIPIIDDGIASF